MMIIISLFLILIQFQIWTFSILTIDSKLTQMQINYHSLFTVATKKIGKKHLKSQSHEAI